MVSGNSLKKVIIIVVCFAISVIGIYMQFFYKEKGKDNLENSTEISVGIDKKTEAGTEQIKEDSTVVYEYDYSNQELPTEENESSDELYMGNGGDAAKIFFSDTEKLDQCSMPMEAQADLVDAVQRFLIINGYENVTELHIDNEQFVDNEKVVSFLCEMQGFDEKLQVTFSKTEGKLSFAFVYIDTED